MRYFRLYQPWYCGISRSLKCGRKEQDKRQNWLLSRSAVLCQQQPLDQQGSVESHLKTTAKKKKIRLGGFDDLFMRDLFSFLAVKTSGAIFTLFFWLDTGLRVRAVSIPQSRESSIIEDYDLWKVLAHELYITDKFSVSWPPAATPTPRANK